MKDEKTKDVKTVQIFVGCAESFCALIENHSSYQPYEFVMQCSILLMDLYKAALNLPDVESSTTERIDYGDSNQVEDIATKLPEKFNGQDFYLFIFDPFTKEVAVGSTISSDLLEIYDDIKGNLILFHKGTGDSMRNALWQWKFDFSYHWGQHLVNIMRPMYSLLFWRLWPTKLELQKPV